jgi:nicotinamide-nucleotide amidase
MNPMVENYVLPELKKRYERNIIKAATLHVSGLSESAVFEKIRGVVETERRMEGNLLGFTILAGIMGIDIKLMGRGDDELLLDNMIHKAKQEMYDRLKEDIYGEDAETLEEITVKMLCKKKLTIAVAESCTGGMLANMITNASGSSLCFKQGFVTYTSESKINTLKVSEQTIKQYGAVSGETAKEMADGVRGLCGTDIGLATTGIAGPTGGTGKKPVGLVFIAVSKQDDVFFQQFRFAGNRTDIKTKVACAALDLLRRHI